MGENLAAGWHDEWRSGFPLPDVLRQPGVAALQRPLATEDAPGLSGDPLGGMTGTGAQGRSFGRRVINPCPFHHLRLRPGRPLGRVIIGHRQHHFPPLRFAGINFGRQPGQRCLVLRRLQLYRRRRQQRVAVHRRIRRTVKKRIQRIEFFVRDGVELVVMANRTAGRQPHPRLHRRRGAVDRITEYQLGINRSTFARRHVAAAKPRCNKLILSWLRQLIASQLVNRELIKWQVLVEGGNHPVAVRPHRPFVVEMQPMGVAISRHIQPVPRHFFAEMT